jgi:DNA polymerase III alpha subunit
MYMKEKNIDVLPPDINKSKTIFWVEGNGLRIGLGALRGVGQDAIEAVIKERTEHGLFKDFADFVTRCTKYINKRIVESLIYAGAFDGFGYARSQVAAVYEEVLTRVSAREKQKGGAQISIFGNILDEQVIDIKYPNLPEYELMEKLAKEKSVLGVYVSGHPFERIMPYFKNTTFNCSMLNAYTENEDSHVAARREETIMGRMKKRTVWARALFADQKAYGVGCDPQLFTGKTEMLLGGCLNADSINRDGKRFCNVLTHF